MSRRLGSQAFLCPQSALQEAQGEIAEVHDEVEAVRAVRSVTKRLAIETGTAILSIRRGHVIAGDEAVNLTLLLARAV